MNRDVLNMIDELIEQYGDSARQIIIDGLSIESKGKNSYKCPNGHAHKNGDRNPSMGWVAQGNYFKCMGCGETINIYTYYKNYLNYTFSEIMQNDGIDKIEKNIETFKKELNDQKKALTKEQKEFVSKRGITQETMKKFKLVNMNGAVGIPYFKRGILTGVKKRMIDAKVKNLSTTGSKFYFFNFDNTTIDKPLIVTEGEWDCMILDQCGFENVVSVGCGANATASLFENATEDIKLFEEIILFTDNDERGEMMDKAFIDAFGQKIAVVDKTLYNNCKDANEVFLKFGKDRLGEIIKSGKAYFDGEWDLDADPYTFLDPSGIKFIKTGIDTIDYAVNCIQSKYVTLITGRSNAGKSTFVNQVMASAINQDFKVFLALGEGNKDKIINKFYTGLIGSNPEYYDVKTFGLRTVKEPKPEVLKAIQSWHKGHLKLFIKALSKFKNHNEMFQMLEYKIKTEKYDLVVLDNQMSLLTVERASDKLEKQAEFVQMCHNLASATNCAVILVLHPNKTYKKGEKMDFEQIAGTSDIANKADIILNVIRVPDDELEECKPVTSKIQVAKNRDESELPTVNCAFDKSTYTMAEVMDGVPRRTVNVGWKKYLNKTNPLEVNPKYIVNIE